LRQVDTTTNESCASGCDRLAITCTAIALPPKYQWWWRNDVKSWTAYDYDQNVQIDQAYTSRHNSVTITGDVGGKFSDSKHKPVGAVAPVYRVDFDRSTKSLPQTTSRPDMRSVLKTKFDADNNETYQQHLRDAAPKITTLTKASVCLVRSNAPT
jgi:hypothetical protein